MPFSKSCSYPFSKHVHDTVNCDTFSNEEKVAVVVSVTSVEVTCSEAMLALSFSTLLVKCLMKGLGRSALV